MPSTFSSLFGRAVLFAFRWKTVGEAPPHPRYVLLAAPHTSNWDFVFSRATFWKHKVPLHWVGKHTLFEGFFGPIFRAMGGIPIDRRARQNMVADLAARFQAEEKFVLAVSVEGTRKRCEYWRSGFYHIARAANVPVVLGALDFSKREATLGPAIFLTGDIKADMDRIRGFYADKVGRNPEWFGPIRLKDEDPAAASGSDTSD